MVSEAKTMLGAALNLAERGFLSDPIIKFGIKRLLKDRVRSFSETESEEFVEELSRSPIAILTQHANEQHYEVPSEYFDLVLGKHKKYSSCLWNSARDLDQAEIEMLNSYVERAEIKNGMSVLELGCGWGSFLLFAAEKFPRSNFTGVSNSKSQRDYILEQAKRRQLTNLEVITANMTNFKPDSNYDRIVSIEMFEHMRNYEVLFARLSSWLKLDGKFFLHIFTHEKYSYPFEVEGDDNWMGKHFFTGGMMPAHNLPLRFQQHLSLENSWKVSGEHYGRTCRAWLSNHDRRAKEVMEVFKNVYGSDAAKWFNRWRIFYLSCAELFDFNNGSEWFVSHYLFQKRLSDA